MTLVSRCVLLLTALAIGGCGYHLAGQTPDPLGPFTVESGAVRVPYLEAVSAAEEGARAELSRLGALGSPSEASSRVVIEVLAVEEAPEGIAAVEGPSGAFPLARGTTLSVTGRATIRRGQETLRDTGDVRATETIARAEDAAVSLAARREAVRRAARVLGERLGRRLLGYPEPGEP
ncbi:MAG: hypothetical protein U0359_17300 [Byssovorax sp.]